MKRGIGIVVAWTGATLLAVLIAAAAVGSVRSQVTDAPTPIGSPSAAALATDIPNDPGAGIGTTSTTSAPMTDAVGTTTTVDATTTTAASPTTSAPPTSAPTTTVATSTTVAASSSRTFDTVAGSVQVIVDRNGVHFGGAFPNPGWRVELEDAGPESVEVHFERNEEEGDVEFTARLEDGELLTQIDLDDD